MLKKVIKPILFLPIALLINSLDVLSNEKKNFIDKVLEEKSNKPFISYQEIENLLNTQIHVLDDSNDIIDTLIGKSNKTNSIKNA